MGSDVPSRRFFQPQRAHIEYMTALEHFRATASPKRKCCPTPLANVTQRSTQLDSTGKPVNDYTSLDSPTFSQCRSNVDEDLSGENIDLQRLLGKRKRRETPDQDLWEMAGSVAEVSDPKQSDLKYDDQNIEIQPSLAQTESLTLSGKPEWMNKAGFSTMQNSKPKSTNSYGTCKPRWELALSDNSPPFAPWNEAAYHQSYSSSGNQPNSRFVERSPSHEYIHAGYSGHDCKPDFKYSSKDTVATIIDTEDWPINSQPSHFASSAKAQNNGVARVLSPQRALAFSGVAEHCHFFQPTVTNLCDSDCSQPMTRPLPAGTLPCDVPCDEECESEDCTSCDGSQICCEPCSDPGLCSSVDCDDPKCFEEPQDICVDHHTPRFNHSFSDIPASSTNSYVNPQHLLLDCHWETSGRQCEASMPSLNSLSQHVLQDHIQPQAILPCQWNHCSNQIEVDEIPTHVWECHSPAPESASYVCLWHGCGTAFSSTEELDTHMKAVHCQISCHWDGCEQATTSEIALKAHVDNKHITKAVSRTPRETSPTSSTLSTPKSLEQPFCDNEKLPGPMNLQRGEAHEPTRCIGACSTVSGNACAKTCQWLNFDTICGKVFDDGNQLQNHIESTHLNDIKRSDDSHLRHSANICQWSGCKNKAPFAERSKLTRHIYVHTKYAVGACRYCGKECNNQNQLKDHERTHTKEKPFICDRCGFKTTNKAALTTHMRIHTGDKPLKCDKCSYTCGDPSNMSKHRKIHELPLHKCEVCERAFCRVATLKRHMLSHEVRNIK